MRRAAGVVCGARIALVGTGTARTTRPASAIVAAIVAAGAAGAARTTRTATGTTLVASTGAPTPTAAITTLPELARRRGQLPADTGARHLATPRTIVPRIGPVLLRADLEAAQPARLVSALAAEAAATEAAATAATAAAAASAVTTAAFTSAAAVVALTPRRTRDAIDHVVKLAPRDRVVRAFLALVDADQADLIDRVADDVERLEQARGAIGLDRQRGCDRLDHRICRRGRRVASFGGRRLGRRVASFGGSFAAFGGSFGAFAGCGSRFGRSFGRRFGRRRGLAFAHLRRSRAACSCARLGRLAQGQRRELGERLHARASYTESRPRASPRGSQPPADALADADTETETSTLAWICVEASTAAAS